MKTMIKQSCKQYKRFKKLQSASQVLVWGGFYVCAVGFVGFISAMMKVTGPQLMMVAFGAGIPIMVIGAFTHELAIYQIVRLRARIRRRIQMIQTIRRREHEFDQAVLTEEQWDSGLRYEEANLLNSSSTMCLSI